MKKLITLFVLLYSITISLAQENYPKPTEKDVIFYIQHNRGKNTFTYQPNFIKPGKLDDKNPLKTGRQLFDNNGEIEPLSPIQKRYAYGVKSSKIANNTFDIRLVSHEDQKLILKVNNRQEAYVETTVNGKFMILKHIFIHQKEGTTGLKTKVDKITFYGLDKHNNSVKTDLIMSK